ncbi:MAG: carboxypeptidase regulatory-like domain-containing protein, partial [Acidobacteria bacterium]|nr:carboxypeptidase regulatory-like domain-containing protein [Acidobacteriota bacterium]
MRRSARCFIAAAWVAASLLALVVPASSQTLYQGRIDVTVQDATGAVLPGVSVSISGPQIATMQTDAKGEAHFLALAPGNYVVRAILSGFDEYTNERVPVGAGASVPLRISLRVAGVTA